MLCATGICRSVGMSGGISILLQEHRLSEIFFYFFPPEILQQGHCFREIRKESQCWLRKSIGCLLRTVAIQNMPGRHSIGQDVQRTRSVEIETRPTTTGSRYEFAIKTCTRTVSHLCHEAMSTSDATTAIFHQLLGETGNGNFYQTATPGRRCYFSGETVQSGLEPKSRIRTMHLLSNEQEILVDDPVPALQFGNVLQPVLLRDGDENLSRLRVFDDRRSVRFLAGFYVPGPADRIH